MPMYKVKCERCGKEFKTLLTGKNSDWVAENGYHICQECKQKEIEQKAKEAAEKAKREGLPELSGSEKQIRWAEQIRTDFLNNKNRIVTEVLNIFPLMALEKLEFESEEERKEWKEKIEKAVEEIFSTETKASFWIDRRGGLLNTIIEKLKK